MQRWRLKAILTIFNCFRFISIQSCLNSQFFCGRERERCELGGRLGGGARSTFFPFRNYFARSNFPFFRSFLASLLALQQLVVRLYHSSLLVQKLMKLILVQELIRIVTLGSNLIFDAFRLFSERF